MAISTIPMDADPANAGEEIYTLATDLQARGSRIRSLADTISSVVDEAYTAETKDNRSRLLQNAINFADLIVEEISSLTAMGERIETLSFSVRGQE